MHPWKLLIKLLLITLLAFTASGVVSAKTASGPQSFGLGPLQGQSLFNALPCQEKTAYSTTAAPGCSVVAKGGGSYRPDRVLPRDKHGNPVPDADVPHTQLGTKSGRNGDYTQAREWGYDANGKVVPRRDIDFTDHGRPQNHPNPHQHDWVRNPTGGTPQHGPAKPLEWP